MAKTDGALPLFPFFKYNPPTCAFLLMVLLQGMSFVLPVQKSYSQHLTNLREAQYSYHTSPLTVKYTANDSILTLSHAVSSNRYTYPKDQPNWAAFAVTSAAVAGLYTGLFMHYQDRRWGSARVPFFFTSKLGARGIDKAGHFFASKSQASLIGNMYSMTATNPETSVFIGAGIALSVQTLIEVKDGHIYNEGFDVYDQIANILGAGWYYSREKSNFMQRFNIRWFYYPSVNHKLVSNNALFTNDYNGHTYWLSMQTHDLLPSSLQTYWPAFLVPAIGISLNDWSKEAITDSYYSFHLSLNPDFRHIFSQKSAFGRTLSDLFNSFYIPAPALQLYPDPGFKLVFYGQ